VEREGAGACKAVGARSVVTAINGGGARVGRPFREGRGGGVAHIECRARGGEREGPGGPGEAAVHSTSMGEDGVARGRGTTCG
jgi:hypothetical protein